MEIEKEDIKDCFEPLLCKCCNQITNHLFIDDEYICQKCKTIPMKCYFIRAKDFDDNCGEVGEQIAMEMINDDSISFTICYGDFKFETKEIQMNKTERIIALGHLKQKLAYVGWKRLNLINLEPLKHEVDLEMDKILIDCKNNEENLNKGGE